MTASSVGGNQYTSSWIGLGSGTGKDSYDQQWLLDQAGTLQSIVSGKASYSFFWEFFPYNGEQIHGPSIAPGEDVYVEVDHNGTGETMFTLFNEVTDQGGSFNEYWPSQYAEGGGTAEWIMERPEECMNSVWEYPALADYNKLTFSAMSVINNLGDTYYPGDLNRYKYVMDNCIDTSELSSPANLVNGSTGTVYWHASGTGESVQNCTGQYVPPC